MNGRTAVFAYGALASISSAQLTLGRAVEYTPPVRLTGWRRRWSQARDNRSTEKTFARASDGTIPAVCLGLNIEPASGLGPNGPLLEITGSELERLALREIRYDPVDVTDAVVADEPPRFDRVLAFIAKPENTASSAPPGAVIIASYAQAVESAFARLDDGQLELFRQTTGPYPVEVVDAVLVNDEIPPGNPRRW
jgi:hypothetical protein